MDNQERYFGPEQLKAEHRGIGSVATVYMTDVYNVNVGFGNGPMGDTFEPIPTRRTMGVQGRHDPSHLSAIIERLGAKPIRIYDGLSVKSAQLINGPQVSTQPYDLIDQLLVNPDFLS